MKVKSLDNISDEVLDILAEKYKDDDQFRVTDDRTRQSNGKAREYFLIARRSLIFGDPLEYTFIWISKNLWQFTYLNTGCNREGIWRDPLEILNELLNKE